MTRNCEGCGHPFDERMMYQMVTAWVSTANRSKMTGKRYEQRWACKPCVDAFNRTGEQWQQLSLEV